MPAFECVLPVRVTDFGPSMHMDNISFQEFVQESRNAFLLDRGLVPGAEGAQLMLVRTMALDYAAPVPFGVTELTMTVEATHIGRTSFTLRHRMRIDDDVVFTAEVVLIASNSEDRSEEISPRFRAELESILTEETEEAS
ncbi:acyl-CoA thioesterase [Dietzia sp. 179-F 9C3 NHS]|uniref:acyl-CoA thioesterase n=1 Tax=Dietzia sp. 179-F 9C3 NHS TaxID=3374295 RepID=UPI00387A0F5F